MLSRATLRLGWEVRGLLFHKPREFRPTTGTRRSCFLCTTWRSGSTFLGDAVRSVADLDLSRERFYLNPQQASLGAVLRGRSLLAFLDHLVDGEANRQGIFGTKVMWADFLPVLRRLRRIPDFRGGSDLDILRAVFPAPTFLFLTRTDKLRQAISFYRAAGSRVWHRDDRGHLYVTPRPARSEPEYDRPALEAALERIGRSEQAWRGFFRSNAIEPLHLTYEEVCTSLPDAVGRVLERLGLAGSRERLDGVRSKYVKIADAKTDAWVERFRGDRGEER